MFVKKSPLRKNLLLISRYYSNHFYGDIHATVDRETIIVALNPYRNCLNLLFRYVLLDI